MDFDQAMERALAAPEPLLELRALAQQLLAQKSDRAAVLASFENSRQRLREQDREADEDAVLEVMDFLTDWCSPHVRISAESGQEPGADQAQVPKHLASDCGR